MMGILLSNLGTFGIMMLLYLLMFLANTVMGVYFNTDILDNPFDWKKFWKGIRKGIIAAAGMTLMVTGFSLVPNALTSAGFQELADQFANVLSLASVIYVAFQAIYSYGVQALDKFKAIMKVEATIDVAETQPSNEEEEAEG